MRHDIYERPCMSLPPPAARKVAFFRFLAPPCRTLGGSVGVIKSSLTPARFTPPSCFLPRPHGGAGEWSFIITSLAPRVACPVIAEIRRELGRLIRVPGATCPTEVAVCHSLGAGWCHAALVFPFSGKCV
ncbi:hypothetical protein E2C01_096076 [Portunus trituberculatus]|uniref:Uncharacterized protein n=1 Tax=Portunus trituberculatus TaxID=210409 RepID=A0A5B7JX15_PORTR|nr:hypothetical protein [Portunus trituberculatus]